MIIVIKPLRQEEYITKRQSREQRRVEPLPDRVYGMGLPRADSRRSPKGAAQERPGTAPVILAAHMLVCDE